MRPPIISALIAQSGGDAINLGGGAEVPIHELARRIASITGYTGRIQWDPIYPEGTLRRVLDLTRAPKEFGFRARRSLADGLLETIDTHAGFVRVRILAIVVFRLEMHRWAGGARGR